MPLGWESASSDVTRTTYLDVKLRSEEIVKLYRDSGVLLHHNSGLAKFVKGAADLSDNWIANDTEQLTVELLFKSLHLHRVADALQDLALESNYRHYLAAMTSGSVDFFERKKSRAKDILWELEVWRRIRKRTKHTFLKDPPDIIVNIERRRIGIACKKTYSERSVPRALSDAVNQVESDFDIGIAALNIDDLVPEGSIVKAESFQDLSQLLQNHNLEFIHRHERHFQRYLSPGRLAAVIISTAVVADVARASPRLNNAAEWTIWTIPGLEAEKETILNRFAELALR